MRNGAALGRVLAAIDVGTNAVRLELARPLPDGSLETLHQERDPVRPGEGVFQTGTISRQVADRLLATLSRYAALCRRHQAQVRAVATSAIREAKNGQEVVARARREARLNLEVVSGREEARLICLGVLHGAPPARRSLCIDIGGGSTEIAYAVGERPKHLWSVALGAVRLTELFDCAKEVSPKKLRLMREYVGEAIRLALPKRNGRLPEHALGSSGTIHEVVDYAASEGTQASAKELTRAVDNLADMGFEARRRRFDSRRSDIIVAGAVILEAIAHHLDVKAIAAVDRGLRDGLLIDLMRRHSATESDRDLIQAARDLGKRFQYDERHASHVSRIALALFDQLPRLHGLPRGVRPFLEIASLLHDIGNSVSYQRHHRHTYYLIHHADIPGLADRERLMVARIARYHRRNLPEPGHPELEDLSRTEVHTVRKLATLLRVADSLDRSHQQPVRTVRARSGPRQVLLRIGTRGPVELELWDLQHEVETFREVFGRGLGWSVGRA